jgi:hypothetical protein
VPLRGWRSEGNSIYDAQMTLQRIQYQFPFINHTQIGEINRVGYEFPEKVSYIKPPKINPHVKALNVPFRRPNGLFNSNKYRRGQSLNNNLTMADTESINLKSNSLFNPSTVNVDYNNSGNGIATDAKTQPTPSKSLNSSVGLGTMVFDAFLRE